jgi:hypothetical protein
MSKGEIIIRTGDLPAQVTISAAWVAKRDEIVEQASQIKIVESDLTYEAAAELLNEAKKMSSSLEKLRLDFTRPFVAVQKTIKGAADRAREPLEAAVKALDRPMLAWVMEKRRRVEEERRRIEAAERAAAEEAAAKAAAEAELWGEEAEPEQVVIAPPPMPVETVARSSEVRTVDVIEFTVTDPDKVPRAFVIVDERKLRAYRDLHKDRIKAALADGGKFDAVDGVEWRIETKINTSGR